MLRHEALLDGTSDLKIVVYAIKFPLQLSFSQGRCDVAPYLPGNDAGENSANQNYARIGEINSTRKSGQPGCGILKLFPRRRRQP